MLNYQHSFLFQIVSRKYKLGVFVYSYLATLLARTKLPRVAEPLPATAGVTI